jgi:hypothetical protein
MELRVLRSNWRSSRTKRDNGGCGFGVRRDSEDIPAYCLQSQAERARDPKGYQRRAERASKIWKFFTVRGDWWVIKGLVL